MLVALLKSTVLIKKEETEVFTWIRPFVLNGIHHILLNFLDKNWEKYEGLLVCFNQKCDFLTRREAIQHLKKTTKYKRVRDWERYSDYYEIELK